MNCNIVSKTDTEWYHCCHSLSHSRLESLLRLRNGWNHLKYLSFPCETLLISVKKQWLLPAEEIGKDQMKINRFRLATEDRYQDQRWELKGLTTFLLPRAGFSPIFVICFMPVHPLRRISKESGRERRTFTKFLHNLTHTHVFIW